MFKLFRSKKYLTRVETDKAVQKSLATSPRMSRIKFNNLHLLYCSDPVIFNGVNLLAESTVDGFKVTSSKKRTGVILQDFVKRTGFAGTQQQVARDLIIFGNSFIERARNKKGMKVVKFIRVQPQTMSFLSEKGDIAVENGRVKGWEQDVSRGKPISFNRDEMFQMKLIDLGETQMGLGLCEPLYSASVRKINIEEALAQTSFRHGFPLFVGKVGDINHEPSGPAIDELSAALTDLTSKSKLTLPYYFNVEQLEGADTKDIEVTLDHLLSTQSAGLGIPLPFLTGKMEGVGRTMMSFLNERFVRHVLSIREIMETVFKSEFEVILEQEGIKNYEFDFSFTAPSELSLTDKVERLQKLVFSGLLAVSPDVRDQIRKAEGFDPEPPGAETYIPPGLKPEGGSEEND